MKRRTQICVGIALLGLLIGSCATTNEQQQNLDPVVVKMNTINDLIDKGYDYINNGLLNEALDCFNNVIAEDETDFRAYTGSGYVFELSGMYNDAIDCYKKAISLFRDASFAYIHQGICLSILGYYEEAIECYNQAIRINPKDSMAYNNKGFVYDNLEQYDKSIECYDTAISIKPNASSYYNKAWVLKTLLKWDEALECFNNAITLDSSKYEFYYEKGNTLYDLRNYEEAIKTYDKGISIAPDFAQFYYMKGCSYLLLDNIDECLKNFYLLANLEPEKEEIKTAIEQLETVKTYKDKIAHNGESSEINNAIGTAFATIDMHDFAVDYFDKAITLEPSNLTSYFNKVVSLYFMSSYEEANSTLEKILELDPDNQDALNFIELIKTL